MKWFVNILTESIVETLGSLGGMAVGFVIWCGAREYWRNP